MTDEFDQLVDDLTKADIRHPSLPQMGEDEESIADDTTELSLKKKAQEFYHPDQIRDQGGRWVDEGKGAGKPGYKDPEEAGLTGIDKRIVDYVAHRPLSRSHEEVRSIRKYVDGIHYVPYSKTPFFDQLNKLQGTPDVEKVDIKDFAKARKELFAKQPISVLKVDDLIASQPVVNKDKVKKNLREDHIKAIAVVHYGDKYFVMDGHHALAAAAKRGDHSIEAHVLNERITQAAFRSGDEVFTGKTHTEASDEASKVDAWGRSTPMEHGFVTSLGRFVDRREALKVAREARQTNQIIGELDAGYGGRNINSDENRFRWNGETQQFDQASGKTQERDASGRYTNEGKVGGTTIEPRLAGLTRETAQPVLPGYRTNPPHHAEIFYSPNETNMTWHHALDAMNGSRQKVALDVTHDVDFQLGLKSEAHNAIGDWSDGAENSVVNEISNIRDFDEVRHAAAQYGKQLHQKAVLAFEEDRNGEDAIYSVSVPTDNIALVRENLDVAGIPNRTILPEGMNTRIILFDKGGNKGGGLAVKQGLEPMQPGGNITLELLKKSLANYTQDENDKETLRIEVTKGNGEFVGEAERRSEAGSNYDKIIADYEAKYPNRRHYVRAQGPGDYDNRNKVGSGKTHLLSKVTSKEYGEGGSSTVYYAKFEDGSQGVWKPESGSSNANRDYIDQPISPREVATYEVAKEIGLDDLVPETIMREVDGEEGSMMDFVEDAKVGWAADTEHEYDGDKDLARAAAFDYLIGNTDRHGKNWMISNKDHSLHLIDNGLTFPTQDGGFGNEYLIDQVKSRRMDIPTEASKWVDHLPAIKKILEARGLDNAYDALEHRANKLAKSSSFRDLSEPDSGLQMKSSSPAKPVELKPPATGAAPDLASRKGEARQIAKDRPLRIADATHWDEAKLKEIKALPSKNDTDTNIVHASEYVDRHGRIVDRESKDHNPNMTDIAHYEKYLNEKLGKRVRWNVTKGWHYEPVTNGSVTKKAKSAVARNEVAKQAEKMPYIPDIII